VVWGRFRGQGWSCDGGRNRPVGRCRCNAQMVGPAPGTRWSGGGSVARGWSCDRTCAHFSIRQTICVEPIPAGNVERGLPHSKTCGRPRASVKRYAFWSAAALCRFRLNRAEHRQAGWAETSRTASRDEVAKYAGIPLLSFLSHICGRSESAGSIPGSCTPPIQSSRRLRDRAAMSSRPGLRQLPDDVDTVGQRHQ
jgi:hypothetical protein